MKKHLDNFYVKSSLFTLLSLFAALCNYALYPLLVRILPPTEFGDFAVASATLNQVLSILLAINIVSIYLVKKYNEDDARAHTQVVQKALLWLFGVLCLLMLAFWPVLQSLFKIEHASIFIPMASVLILSILLTVWNGYLQGNKELIRIGIGTLGASFAKLVFALLLGLLAGAIGAMFGVLAGTIAGIVILRFYPGIKTPGLDTLFKKMSHTELRNLLRLRSYVIQVALVVGALGIIQSYDISLSKILFSPELAGTYSGVSILGAALYYLAFILVWIILPEISIDNQKVNRRVLTTAYKLYLALAVVAVAGILLLGNSLLPIILGPMYSGKTEWLLFGALYQLTIASIALYTYSLLVRHKKRAVLLAGLVFALCIAIPPILGSANPATMIRTLWLSAVCGVGLYAIIMTIYKLFKKSAYNTQ